METVKVFSLRVCVVAGALGLLVCSAVAGVSLVSIQAFLLKLDLAALTVLPAFYMVLGSFVGFAGSTVLIVKKPSSPKSSDNSRSSKPSMSSEKVVSSGASGAVLTLMPGTKLQNESGTTLELSEPYILWPKFATSEVPEEPKEQVKSVVKEKPRFFKRVEA
jgi:hypothetical protein